MNDETLFHSALEKPAGERAAFLLAACGGDDALRQRVEALLRAYENPGSFLVRPCPESPLAALATDPGTMAARSAAAPDLSFLAAASRPDALGRLGHYEILEVVGSGAFGIVLKAFDDKLHRIVAIKALRQPLAASATARKRFVREAQAAATVSHDNVVDIYAVEEEGPVPYLVMEYVAGVSLEEKLRREGPLPLKEVLRIGLQVAEGLAAAHKQGLVHRDVKPANIMLENSVQRVRITDFGLARAVDDASLSQTGTIAGTPSYMSPEQARGESVDHRADLFSLGSVLSAMCTGRSPFGAETAVAAIRRVCDDTPRPVRDLNPEVPQWLVEIMDRLLAKQPAERFQSAEEVAELISRHLAQVQHPVAVTLRVTSPAAAHRAARWEGLITRSVMATKRRWTLLGAALLGLLVTVGLTEATGVTHLAGTVIRIAAGEGTLLVEVDDPGVKVTIEGDGGLVITGAGPQEVRLRPGSYRVQADKDGKRVPLEKELVTITRGDKQVVRVRLEGKTASPMAASKAERGTFVVLGGKGVPERKFGTLAEAVLAASDGATIEIRASGPFVSPSMKIERALTIRAAEGFQPVIQLDPAIDAAGKPLVYLGAALVLEGIALQRAAALTSDINPRFRLISLIESSRHGALFAANCRFVNGNGHAVSIVDMSPGDPPAPLAARLVNCELLTKPGPGSSAIWHSNTSGQLVFEYCVHTSPIIVHRRRAKEQPVSIELTGNSLAGRGVFHMFDELPAPTDPAPAQPAVQVNAEGNIFADQALVFIQRRELDPPVSPRDAQTLVSRLSQWRQSQNVYPTGADVLAWAKPRWIMLDLARGRDLADWNRFWNLSDTASIAGEVRFVGGNLAAKAAANVAELTAADFRLIADSPGYRAGPDGEDLGADIDLVGPGVAYERFKKTPEYQQWLKETGQAK